MQARPHAHAHTKARALAFSACRPVAFISDERIPQRRLGQSQLKASAVLGADPLSRDANISDDLVPRPTNLSFMCSKRSTLN
eukprot:6182190-Pleurochrysis_carterae.AAC.4